MIKGLTQGWFGPKKVGWGVSPRTWQGWFATLLFVLASVGIQSALEGAGAVIWVGQIALLAGFLGLVYLTYDPRA